MGASPEPEVIDAGWRLWDALVECKDEAGLGELVARATPIALTQALRIGDLYPANSRFYAQRRAAIKRERRRQGRALGWPG